MDILAHGLWTNVMYKVIPNTQKDRKITRWGIFFGIFPDLFAFTPVFTDVFFRLIFFGQRLHFGPPEDNGQTIPLDNLTHHLYNLSHSLVVWALVFALAWLIFRRLPWVLLGWALHICIDIFSHNSHFFATPFLWPISNFHVEGWSWGSPVFMIVNYSLLLILYIFLVPRLKSKLK